MAFCTISLIICAIADDQDYLDDAKACQEFLPKPVRNFCYKDFPGKHSPKLLLILFTSHACFHCGLVKRPFVELASRLQDNPGVVVGAVNCYFHANYHALCTERQVDGLPSLRIIERGAHNATEERGSNGQYPRHSPEDVDRLVKAALEQQPACPRAAAHADDGAVVPLCAGRFPSEGNVGVTWLVVFYSRESPSELLRSSSAVSLHLGNAAKLGGGAEWQRRKKRDRLLAIGKEYGVKLAPPADGPYGYGSFAKVGAVCCDCDAQQGAFCADAVAGGQAPTLPLAAWVKDGQQVAVEAVEETRASLMEFALARLGFLAGEDGEL